MRRTAGCSDPGPIGATGAIMSMNSPIYNTLATMGETNFYEDTQGNFNAIFNTDSGGAFSSGVGAYMPNACLAH